MLNFFEDNFEILVMSVGYLNFKLYEMLFCFFVEVLFRVWNIFSVVFGVFSVGCYRVDVINLVGSFVIIIFCVLEV